MAVRDLNLEQRPLIHLVTELLSMVSLFNFIKRHLTELPTCPFHQTWCLELCVIKL